MIQHVLKCLLTFVLCGCSAKLNQPDRALLENRAPLAEFIPQAPRVGEGGLLLWNGALVTNTFVSNGVWCATIVEGPVEIGTGDFSIRRINWQEFVVTIPGRACCRLQGDYLKVMEGRVHLSSDGFEGDVEAGELFYRGTRRIDPWRSIVE